MLFRKRKILRRIAEIAETFKADHNRLVSAHRKTLAEQKRRIVAESRLRRMTVHRDSWRECGLEYHQLARQAYAHLRWKRKWDNLPTDILRYEA